MNFKEFIKTESNEKYYFYTLLGLLICLVLAIIENIITKIY